MPFACKKPKKQDDFDFYPYKVAETKLDINGVPILDKPIINAEDLKLVVIKNLQRNVNILDDISHTDLIVLVDATKFKELQPGNYQNVNSNIVLYHEPDSSVFNIVPTHSISDIIYPVKTASPLRNIDLSSILPNSNGLDTSNSKGVSGIPINWDIVSISPNKNVFDTVLKEGTFDISHSKDASNIPLKWDILNLWHNKNTYDIALNWDILNVCYSKNAWGSAFNWPLWQIRQNKKPLFNYLEKIEHNVVYTRYFDTTFCFDSASFGYTQIKNTADYKVLCEIIFTDYTFLI